MKQLKSMIFEVLQMEQKKRLMEIEGITSEEYAKLNTEYIYEELTIYDNDFKQLIFGIFKENAKTKQINPAVWLYLNNDNNSFKYILEDIFHECYCNYLEDSEMAYKNTMKYIYNTYYKTQTRQRPLEHHENEIITTIDDEQTQASFNYYSIKLDSKEKADYYKSILLRTYDNLHKKQKRVFTSTRQKQQTLDKLKKLQMI